MKKLRILFFSDAEREGGAEKYFFSLAKGLSREDFFPVAVCSTDPHMDSFVQNLKDARIPLFRIPAVKTLRNLPGFIRLWIFFLFRRFHVLHFNLTHPRACNAAIVSAVLAGQTRIVVTDQLPQIRYGPARVPLRHRLASRWIRHSIVVAHALKEILVRAEIPESQISVVHNAIDTEAPLPAVESEKKRRDLGVGKESLVGMVGRLTEQKGYPCFFQAAALVKERFAAVRFLVLGEGEDEKALKEMTKTLGIEKDVLFLGQRDDVAEILSILDVSVLTSNFEGLPFIVLESMAMAKPVVVTDIPGMKEAVQDGDTGYVVPPKNGEAAARAILDLLSNPDKAEEMGRRGRERVKEAFSLQGMIQSTAAVYRKIME